MVNGASTSAGGGGAALAAARHADLVAALHHRQVAGRLGAAALRIPAGGLARHGCDLVQLRNALSHREDREPQATLQQVAQVRRQLGAQRPRDLGERVARAPDRAAQRGRRLGQQRLRIGTPGAHQVLGALGRDASHEYLGQRIRAGGGAAAILHEEAMEAIHELGRGLPGRMNTLADNALFEAFLAARRAEASP